EPVFGGNDRQELLRQIAFEEPRSPRLLNRAIPADLETVVLKALAKDPGERYATAQELADDLRRYLGDEPIKARRPTLWQRARKWARRHQGVVWAAAAGLVLAVIVLAVMALLLWLQIKETEQKRQDAVEKQQEADREADAKKKALAKEQATS